MSATIVEKTSSNEIFAKVTKAKVRFPSSKGGTITVEDLWDLSLDSLDAVAKALYTKIKANEGAVSFINGNSGKDKKLEIEEDSLEVVKYVIETKIAERDAKAKSAKRRQELAFLKEVQANKNADAMKSMTADELAKKIAELEAEG